MAFVQNPTNQQRIETEYSKDQKAVRDESAKIPFYYLKKGKTLLRVLPSFNSAGVWFTEHYEHKLPLAGKMMGFTCGRPYGESCAACDKGEILSIAGDQSYKDFQPKRTYLFNVVVLSDPSGTTAKDGVKVLKSGIVVKKGLVDLDRAYGEGFGDITNLEKGYTLSIERTGDTMKDTRYNVKPFREPTNIVEVLKAQGVDSSNFSQYNLNEAIPMPRPDEEVRAAIEGTRQVVGFPAVIRPHGVATTTANVTPPVVHTPTPLTVGAPVQPAARITIESVAVPVIPDPPTNN